MNPEDLSLKEKAPETPAPPAEETLSILKQIRTYQGDVADALKEHHESLFSIHRAEKARADLLKKNEEPEEKEAGHPALKAFAYFLGSVILLGATGAAGWYAYTLYSEKTAVPTPSAQINRFLPVTDTQNVNTDSLTRENLISIIASERGKTLPSGNVRHIELLKGSADTSPLETPTQFLLLMQAKPPGNFVRALEPLFMIGILGGETNETFLLMRLDSYENAYAGMLEWENNIKEDMLPLFQSEEVIATIPQDAQFRDVTVRNKDARVLTSTDGKSVLIYSFYNQNLLIITSTESALRTITSQLDTQALAR